MIPAFICLLVAVGVVSLILSRPDKNLEIEDWVPRYNRIKVKVNYFTSSTEGRIILTDFEREHINYIQALEDSYWADYIDRTAIDIYKNWKIIPAYPPKKPSRSTYKVYDKSIAKYANISIAEAVKNRVVQLDIE